MLVAIYSGTSISQVVSKVRQKHQTDQPHGEAKKDVKHVTHSDILGCILF